MGFDTGKQGLERMRKLAKVFIGVGCLAIGLGFGLLSLPVFAQSDFKLGMPIDCEIGKSCWILNLVDLDPGPEARDYQCKTQSYDGHKGTDFAIRDLKVMKKGVRVQASAAGVVRGVRDGMADQDVTIAGSHTVKGKECGNGAVIAHAGGWETQYCHMRKGSVAIKSGDRVKKGQFLGLVGHSGKAAFPHLHFQVRHKKKIVDPFVGEAGGQKCGVGSQPLWEASLLAPLTQPLPIIFSAGFAAIPPKTRLIKAGEFHDKALSRQAPAFLMWGGFYRLKKGDLLAVQITSPDGSSFLDYKKKIEKSRVRFQVLYAGKKRKPLFWPEGLYKGVMTVIRKSSDGTEKRFRVARQILVR